MLRDDFAGHLDERGRLVVNDHLQIEGYPHIFGMGDAIIHPPSDELKLGHTAELNAHVVVANVIKLSEGADVAELERYPEGRTAARRLHESIACRWGSTRPSCPLTASCSAGGYQRS